MSVKNSALAAACCALLLAAPLALAQSAAANTSINSTSNTGNNGPKTPQEAAACRSVVNSLLGGFGAMLGNTLCTVQPATKG
ncbi:hypothetical protein ACIG0C_18815 [Kitasatospora aureofaciens]|uniref:Chaplin domain-containing protein n=1 Tax=Kitasatospora aureofaciens TaxID=1894 RepID=A0A1E7NCL2_KITAU|nr:hypothetical protein [Kitasatospora aureofaciens]ARF82211.1 hypothetical protein B6264_28020 [Kitasatospora aureofaciens]OEV38398.1 hypothetical protein HS99_0021035 [Kitasatospora aureofaciens]GGU85296.1 hypothetical protein GCM10010502_41920 [Kitasatospora aureofaciens]HJD82167.1 hypothetical protein [Kitasatospora aureofaciens]